MLDELRKKPKAVREQYAFFGAVGITGIIAAVWVISLSVRFGAEDFTAPVDPEATGAFAQFYNDAKENVGEIIDVVRGPDVKESESAGEVAATTTRDIDTKASNEPSAIDDSIQEAYDAFRFPSEAKEEKESLDSIAPPEDSVVETTPSLR